MNKAPDQLKQSIIILKRISNSLVNVERGIRYIVDKRNQIPEPERTADSPDFFHLHTAMWCNLFYTIINYCSFIDEFSNHFMLRTLHEPETHEAIREGVRGPLSEMKKAYGDVKSVRNYVLAHGFRKNSKPLIDEDIYKGFNGMVNQLEPTNFSLPSITTQQIIQIIEDHYTPLTEAEFGF